MATKLLEKEFNAVDTKLNQLETSKEKVFRDYAELKREHLELTGKNIKLTEELKQKSDLLDKTNDQLQVEVKNTSSNFVALFHVATAYLNVTNYMIAIAQAGTDDTKMKFLLSAALASALDSMNDVFDKYKPTDQKLLSWAYVIRGTVFHLQQEYGLALRDLEIGLETSPDNNNAQYNAACSAALLGNKDKAIKYIEKVIKSRPERLAEAKNDPDLALIKDELERL